jgi:D-glycero-alpha-D-manno-heptose 1-phosphate guanylyltransferase
MVSGEPRHDALILCGGLGTRLRQAVADRPKGLAEVAGRPFLDILIDALLRQGLDRFVLCAGYGADQIAARYAARRDAQFLISVEQKPLGTAGAVRHALPHVASDAFFVLNGDSWCEVDYGALHASHASRGARLSIVVVSHAGRDDAGTVALAEDGALLSFDEKAAAGERTRTVNAGIYLMHRSVIAGVPPGVAASLERDVFPQALRNGGCYGFRVAGPLVDIGTPERYHAAQELLRGV